MLKALTGVRAPRSERSVREPCGARTGSPGVEKEADVPRATLAQAWMAQSTALGAAMQLIKNH